MNIRMFIQIIDKTNYTGKFVFSLKNMPVNIFMLNI